MGSTPPEPRFWQRVTKGSPDKCWPWIGAVHRNGYGAFSPYHGVNGLAHRWAWAFTSGEMPDGKVFICHKCDNRLCCNPAHLFLGNHRENMKDARHKGRMHPGEQNAAAKLTDSDVREILASSESNKNLAARYSVTRGAILHIRAGRTWTHIRRENMPRCRTDAWASKKASECFPGSAAMVYVENVGETGERWVVRRKDAPEMEIGTSFKSAKFSLLQLLRAHREAMEA